jgi:hypothetical protein
MTARVTPSVSIWRMESRCTAAEGAANGHLPLPCRGAGQQQTGNVDGADDEHKGDCPEQQQQRHPGVAGEDDRHRLHEDAAPGSLLGLTR